MSPGCIRLDIALEKRSKSLNLQNTSIISQHDQIAKWKISSQKSASKLSKCENKAAEIAKNILIGKHQKIWIEENEKLEARREYLQNIIDTKYPIHTNIIVLDEAKKVRDSASDLTTLTINPSQIPDALNSNRMLQNQISKLLQADQRDIQDLERQISNADTSTGLLHFDMFVKFKDDILPFSALKYQHVELHSQYLKDSALLSKWFDNQSTSLHNEYLFIFETPLGGLDDATYSLVKKIKDEYSTVHKEHLPLLYESIKRQSRLTHTGISKFLDWDAKHIAYISKKEIIKLTFNKRMEDFIQSTINGIIEEEEMTNMQAAVQKDNMARAERIRNLHTSMELWRFQQVERMKKENEKAEEQLQKSIKQELERQKKEDATRAEEAAKLEKYREKRQAEKIKQQELQKRLEANIKEQMKIEANYNKERIHYRANEMKRKEAEQVKRIEKFNEQRLELEKRLEKLRLSVAIEAQSNRERTVGETFASKQYKESIVKTHRADWWNYSTGFTTEEVFKDDRMKLSLELFKNGLGKSDYGNQLLNSMKPQHNRPDQITTLKLGHL